MAVTVKPLSAALVPDLLAFFDTVAFTDNADWASCYCYFYHHDPAEGPWDERTGAENRPAAEKLALEGGLRGYLAFSGAQAVAWCNVNDKTAYRLLASQRELWDEGPDRIAAAVCFIVAPAWRQMGIARELLRRACAEYAQARYDFMEAYPRKDAGTAAANYHGPLSLYRSAGFEVHRELESSWIVRKDLRTTTSRRR